VFSIADTRNILLELLTPYRWDMRRSVAAAGTSLFFLLAPGLVAGVVPYWLTGWRFQHSGPWWTAGRVLGVVLLAAGIPVLVSAFVRFVREGAGTPAPVAPTEHLVVGGFYRYVRNPMYLAVLAVVVGQALLLGQPVLLLYAAIAGAAMVAFVLGYEQPALHREFGAEYDAYRRAVPGWWPRLRPWRGAG
jgi:protein-S-isoprenylcysteine O-methyltransferase Ste14